MLFALNFAIGLGTVFNRVFKARIWGYTVIHALSKYEYDI